jgi:hypothetical protein
VAQNIVVRINRSAVLVPARRFFTAPSENCSSYLLPGAQLPGDQLAIKPNLFIKLQATRRTGSLLAIFRCGQRKQEAGTMTDKFDIFKKLPDGQPMWVRAVEGLTEAKEHIDELTRSEPGEYFLYNSPSGKIISFPEAACAE